MAQQQIDLPRGFRAAVCSSGIKKSGKPDLALIATDRPADCAGVFTTNRVVAAPVLVTAPRIRQGQCQAILVNSGNANACTGEPGLQDAQHCSRLVAEALQIDESLVAVSSTGVIGVPLPMHAFEKHVPELVESLGTGQCAEVAAAMMTTDAFTKLSSRRFDVNNTSCTVVGLAKGAGMIHPDMATMLAFVLTDARIAPDCLKELLQRSVDASFNRITVDRDTSTNDMVLLLASGQSGSPIITAGSCSAESFAQALDEVMLDLAKMIARDGEGATKLVKIMVKGARDDADALLLARSIATSTLVKTAFFGEDANWGRIIAAAGYSGADLDPLRVKIFFDDVLMVNGGLGLGKDREALATAVMQQEEFTVTLDLGLGEGADFYYTSDLGYEYVRINADYRT